MTCNAQITPANITLPDIADSIQCLTPTFPVAPTRPELGDVTPLSIGTVPDFNVTRPMLSSITIPDIVRPSLPAEPGLSVIEIPVAPDFTLPPVPTIRSLDLPTAPTLNLPSFDATAPTLPDAPDATFDWVNADLTTQLSQDIETRLLEFVENDSTGVVIDVQDAIWNRARSRQDELYNSMVSRVTQVVKSRGLKVPQAVVIDFAQRALHARMMKEQSLDREVKIEIARLKQENFRAAVDAILKFESMRIDNHAKYQQRELEGRAAAVELAVKLFNAEVSLYEVDAQVFRVRAEIFMVQLEAELAKLEVYRAELEALQVVSKLNESQVKVYLGRLEGINAQVEVFRAQVEAAKAQAEVNTARLDVFKGRLEAYKATVEADDIAQQAYGAQVAAEGLKVDAYVAEAQAYRAQGDAYGAVVRAQIAQLEADVNVNALFPAEVLAAEVDAFVSVIAAEAAQIAADTAAIAAHVDVESVRLDALGDIAGLAAKGEMISADVDLLCSSITAQSILARARTIVAASNIQQANERQKGQIDGQLAAAEISKHSISNNNSTSESTSNSTAFNTSHNTTHLKEARSIEAWSNSFTNTLVVSL
jgi:hypothetical protein